MNESIFSDPNDVAIDEIKDSLLEEGVTLAIKREDQIHPYISGNKWWKLKYNLLEAKKQGFNKILTFGGAYSNHIAATAVCAYLEGIESIGVIRGEELNPYSNETLQRASSNHMKLHFISRTTYKDKTSIAFINKLKSIYGDFFLIPEGGTNDLAVYGTEEILSEATQSYDFIVVPAGTGGTAAGIIKSAIENQQVLVMPVLRDKSLLNTIEQLSQRKTGTNWRLIEDYHFGGYAKWNMELINFINEFKQKNGIPLDPIYTGKMMFGLFDLIKKNYFRTGTKILAIHTGGLQGISGFNNRYGHILK